MNALARLDPGHAAMALAASTAAIVAIVAVAAEGLARLLARRGASTRHDVDRIALAIVLASPLLALAVGRSRVVLVALPGDRATAERIDELPSGEQEIESASNNVNPVPETRPTSPAVAVAPAPTPRVVASPSRGAMVRGGLVATWLAGAVVLGVRLAVGLAAMAGLRRGARPIDPGAVAPVVEDVREAIGPGRFPPILESGAALRGPVTAGVFRPAIVLPSGLVGRLGEAGLRDVLVHEAAHAARRDGLVGLLQRAAALIYWPHPLVHRLNRRLARSREEVCDDYVLALGDPRRYARTLLLLAESRGRGPGAAVVGLFESGWRLEDRVARVLDPGRVPMTRSHRGSILSAAVLLASAAVAVAAVRPGPAPEPVVDEAGLVFTGTVVDEAGTPVAGAAVDLLARDQSMREFRAVAPARTGGDGRFTLRTDRFIVSYNALIRASADGGRLGVAPVARMRRPFQRAEPARVVLKPSRPLTVRVRDAAGVPVTGAAVEAVVVPRPEGLVEPGRTDDQGTARLLLPADAPLRGVLALKEGLGADYFLNGPGAKDVPTPAEVDLTLDGARTITIRAVGTDGRPVPGVTVGMDGIIKPKRGRELFPLGRITEAKTDGSGVARLGWVPVDCVGGLKAVADGDLQVMSPTPGIGYGESGDMTLTVRVARKAHLSGRVFNPDGSPARGAIVEARGWSKAGGLVTVGIARTAADGSYAMEAPPVSSYLIGVTSPEPAAKALSGVDVRDGERRDGLDLHLTEGTRLRGRVATRPGAETDVAIFILGAEYRMETWNGPAKTLRMRLGAAVAKVDAQGHYEARLGPGEYEVGPTDRRDRATIRVDGTGEVVRDFLGEPAPPSTTTPLTGVVVEPVPGAADRPVAKVGVMMRAAETGFASVTTDEAGRFTLARPDRDVSLFAWDRDRVGFLKVAKGLGEVKVVLGPGATASGRLVDDAGRALTGEGPFLRMRGGPDGLDPLNNMRRSSRLEPGGRYQFTPLIPGAEYEVIYAPGRDLGTADPLPIRAFRVAGPGPIDLGETVIPAARSPAAKP